MSTGSANGLVQDILLTSIPNTVSVGGSIRIGSGNAGTPEVVRVLSIFPANNIVKLQRHIGIAHTSGSNVDVLNNKISIPVKTTSFILN